MGKTVRCLSLHVPKYWIVMNIRQTAAKFLIYTAIYPVLRLLTSAIVITIGLVARWGFVATWANTKL